MASIFDDLPDAGSASGSSLFSDLPDLKQDGALTRGAKNAWNSIKTGTSLLTGDVEAAANLAAERDAYRRANPGTKEGNELMQAWEAGDGVMGGISNVAGEMAKDWRESPGVMAGVRETAKNLSAMGGGIVEQIPNMIAPMGGMLAGGAAGSTLGPVGMAGGAWAGATAGNTLVESGEQVDRALQAAGINPQDKQAVQAFLKENGDKIMGQAGTKGAIIGAVDTATLGMGNALLRAPERMAIERAIATGINPLNKGAISAAVKADPIFQASQKGLSALGRNTAVGALEPAGEFTGEYLGQGVATGDWDTKGATLEALSSLGQSGITFAGQKAYQAATSPLRKGDQAPAPDGQVPTDETLNADNAALAGNIAAENVLPGPAPQLGYTPSVITVPTSDGGSTTIDRNDGPLSAAVVDTGITQNMLSVGMPLQAFSSRLAAQQELDSRPNADRLTITTHPRNNSAFAVVEKNRLTLNALDQAAARSAQLEQEDGNAAQVDATGNAGPGAVGTGGAGNTSSVSGIGSGGSANAAASVSGAGTSGAMGNAGLANDAVVSEAAQAELTPSIAQPVSSMPGIAERDAARVVQARSSAESRAASLASEEVVDLGGNPSTPNQGIAQPGVTAAGGNGNLSQGSTTGDESVNNLPVIRDLVSGIESLNAPAVEGLAKSADADAKSSSDLLLAKAFAGKIKSSSNIPADALSDNHNAAVAKAASDGIAADAKLFGNGANGNAIRVKGFDSLDVKRKGVVQRHMLAALQNDKVFNSVVKLVPVDVMDMLLGGKSAPSSLLDYKSMLFNRLSAPLNNSVWKGGAKFIDAIAAKLPSAFALRVAEEVPGFMNSARISEEVGSAVGAGNGNWQSSVSRRDANNDTIRADGDQAEIEQSTGKLSRQRTVRKPGESQADFEYRRAAEATAARQQASANLAETNDQESLTANVGEADVVAAKDLPNQSETKGMSRQTAQSIELLASLFKKKVVFFRGDNKPDGFWNQGNTLYLNADSVISQIRVLGHEMLHALRSQNPVSYKTMMDAIGNLVTDAELVAQFKDYFSMTDGKKDWTDKQIMSWLGDQANRDMLTEEWVADLSGNRFAEPDFWNSVYQKVEDKYGSQEAKGIISRLRLAIAKVINNILSSIRGGTQFAVDSRMVDHLEQIREALAEGFAQYAQATKNGAIHESTGATKFSGPKQDKLKELAASVPGLAKVIPGLTKQEQAKVGKRNAERIVELFSIMPSEKEMAVVAYAGKAKRGWYKNSANALTHIFGDEARRFAGLLAALSPQVSVEVNTRNALRMWANWTQAGRPTDKPTIMRLLGQSVEGSGTEASVMGAWVNNSMESLTTNNLDGLTLSGPKVNSFMLNLTHRWDEVTNDAWVANYALVDQNLFSGTGKSKDGTDPGKGAGYLAMNAKIRMAAKILSKETGAKWTPAEVQETIWSWAKTMLETLDASGETRTAKQLMEDGVITDDLIASTPDFELLFRQEPYAGILRNAGLEDKLNTLAMPTYEDPGRAPFAEEKRQGLLDQAARRIEFLQRQRRTNLQISWEAKPGGSTGILPGIFKAPLRVQQQYLADIFAEFDMLGAGRILGIDMRSTLFGPSAWKGDVAAGAQTILQKIGIIADNKGSVIVDAESRKRLEVAASILGYVLNQEGVYWHYPIYRAPDSNAMYPTGVEVNFGRSLTTAEVQEFYGLVSKLSGHQDWAPANTLNGVRFLNFTSFNDNPADQFNHRQFERIIERAANRLKPWANGATMRSFTFDGDAIENNWKENPHGEDYKSRVGKAGRSDLLKWADDQLSPAVERINKRYADKYGWGPASRLERDAAESGATPDNFSARFSPARSDAAGNERAGGRDAAAGRAVERQAYGTAAPGAVSVQGFHYSGAERKNLDGRYYGTGAKGQESARVAAAKDKRIQERVYFYVDSGKGITPEQGVGPHGHTVDLNNLYDANADTWVQAKVGKFATNDEWMNAFESAVIDNGFDGYVSDFGTQRAAVLVGRHSVPVTYLGMGKQAGEVSVAKPSNTVADQVDKNRILPMGQMKGADWQRMIPAVVPGADVSMLEPGRDYYKSQVVEAMRGGEVRLSPARETIAAIEKRLEGITDSSRGMAERHLDRFKRSLAGEVVRDEQGNLLAPNGKKSKLTEQQYLQVRTPQFREWFGDWLDYHNGRNGNGVWEDGDNAVSKVVDENGEPMVIYHGTTKGGYTTIEPEKGDKHRSPMVFSTNDRRMARSYSRLGDEIDMSLPEFEGAEARKIGKDWFVVNKGGDGSMAYNVYGEYVDQLDAEGYASKKEAEYFRDTELEQVFRDNAVVQQGIYSLFLNIRNPMEEDFSGANWDGEPGGDYEVVDANGDTIYDDNGKRYFDLNEAKILAKENNGEYQKAQNIGMTTNSVAEEAKQYGHDGVIIHEVVDDGGQYPGGVFDAADVFVFFDSNQAKSATQNTGAFSKKNDDLRYSPARQTETPEFKAWFAGSKVVDSDGRPLVVYHGTTSDFSVFKNTGKANRSGNPDGFYFSPSNEDASDYTQDASYNKATGEWDVTQRDGGNVMPVYLSIQNPFVEGSRVTLGMIKMMEQELRLQNPNLGDDWIQSKLNAFKEKAARGVGAVSLWPNISFDTSAMTRILQAGGYDGFSDGRHWVAFDPTQIKSAIGNNGQFDPNNPDIRESKRRIVGDSGRPYDQAQRQFFNNVGRDIEQKNLFERTRDYLAKDFSKKMAIGIVDQFRGLKDLGPGGMQAYLLARLSKGTAGAFDAFLHHGKLNLRDNVYDADRSGGFIDRLGVALNGELDDFLWWVAANRAEKLTPEDREHLFTTQDIITGKTLANGNTTWDYTIQTGPSAGRTTRSRVAIYADANRVFGEFQKNALDMAEQSGLIDGSTRKYWEHEFYVPFYRVSEEDNEFVGMKMGKALVRQQAFKKLKGGTDKLNSDLLSNTLLNFSHLIEASAKNRAAKASLEAAEASGVAHKAVPGEKKTVWYMDGGQKIEYKVDDPFVMTAITSLEYAGMNNPIMKALSQFKHWLTVGVTASPAFKVRNLIRDSVQAIGTSDLSYNPFKNIAEGWKQTNRDSQEYVSALASGGLIRFGTMLEGSESERTRQLIRSGVKDSTILDNEGKIRQFYDRVLEPAISAYNEIGNRGEEINRAALYNQLIKQGKSHAEAALLARDLMDFSMQGSFTSIRFLTQVVPFMNARLQGMYKLGRSAKDNPKKMAIVTGAIALASIGLMLAYGDDDDWKRREDWDRDNYWWFKVGGLEYRIPKPFELGAVGSLAERGLEYMINDEMTGERFRTVMSNLVLNQLSMNPVPQMVKPVIDIYANKDSFTGRPIENMSMQRLDPTMRYNANTSMPARAASQAMMGALSPMQVDHLVRGYFSWLGAFVVGGADMGARLMSDEPTRPTMDYWRFATQGLVKEEGSGSSRYVTQVYDQAKELEQAHATWKQLIKDGKVEEAKSYREDKADELKRYPRVEAIKKVEAAYNERIRRVERSGIDPDEKKLRIENIQKLKEAAARRIAPGY